ncbi:uncharacterized protein LOC102721136 [Oryza brachyantha]|uniref:uncharacterized protein LOC102721136 n=1 Tax=Oryza brachyantha TaxID=4533 RepID=UPI001ADD2557|nr:uncharacterized protein LOC102721136 [Oryza brachyantha]
MAGLAGDDSSFFGDDEGYGEGEGFCYGPFDVEDFCYGTLSEDSGEEEFCYAPFGDGGGGGGEEFCVSGFAVEDLSDVSSSDVHEIREADRPHDDPLPGTLAFSSGSDEDLADTLHHIVSAMRISEEDEEEEGVEVLGNDGGGEEGLMVSAFDLDTARLIGGILEEDIQVVMGADGVQEEEEEEEAGNGGGIMPNGFEFGSPRVITAAAGFRMMVDAYDTDIYDDFEFVEMLGGQAGDADAGVSTRPSLASQLTVESLPEAALSEEEASRGCAVCMDCFASGQLVALLPCKHYFHGDCIWPWLVIRNTCPVCRHQVRTDDPEYEQRMAWRVIVLAPVEHQDASIQTGGDRATMGAEGATEGVAENGPEQSSS